MIQAIFQMYRYYLNWSCCLIIAFYLFCIGSCGGSFDNASNSNIHELVQTDIGCDYLTAGHDGTLYWVIYDRLGSKWGQAELWRYDLKKDEARMIKAKTGTYLAINTTHAYFAEPYYTEGTGHVSRIPLTGGDMESYITNRKIVGIAIDDQYVYWLETGDSGGVYRAELEDGEPTLLLADQNIWGVLRVDGTHVYWITTRGLARMEKNGSTSEMILNESDWQCCSDVLPGDFVLTDDYLFWVSGNGYPERAGAVVRMRKDGSDLFALARDQNLAITLAVDDEYVYWSRGEPNRVNPAGGKGEIVRIPIDGGDPEIIAEGQNGIGSILLTKDRIYWTNSLRGNIVYMTKERIDFLEPDRKE